MQLLLIGVNSQSAPLPVREKLAIRAEKLPQALAQLRKYVPHAVILSTCNRTEIYAAGADERQTPEGVFCFLKEYACMSDHVLESCLYQMSGRSIVEHLFRVACGLDSMVIGEYEVLGQVRQAVDVAERTGMTNLPLRHIFHSALRAGRKAREETDISKYALSVSSIAINKAMDLVSDIKRSKLIVIGAGEAGKAAARVAAKRGVSNIVIMGRKEESAALVTGQVGGKPASISTLSQELVDTDIVVACAASPHIVLHNTHITQAMLKRSQRPMIIIDIAVPRNVDPSVCDIAGVYLYNIDDLGTEADNNRLQREAEISAVEKLIRKEADLVVRWWRDYNLRPAIKSMMAKAERIRANQYKRTLKKLPDISEEERQAIDLLTISIMDKILHDPISYLKADSKYDETDKVQLIRRIFNLDGDEDE